MSMPIYVPIMKWKKGEQEALKNLSKKHKSKIIPLIEVTDYEDPSDILVSLTNCFSKPIYLDTIIAAEDDREFLISIVEESTKNDKTIYPILYYDDFNDVTKKISSLVNHVGIKIPIPEDIEGPSYEEIFDAIEEFSNSNDIIVDIVLDLNIMTKKTEANAQLRDTKDILRRFMLNKSFYNKIIISSTSFPENISSISAGDNVSFYRYDIALFNRIINTQELKTLKDKLLYSDYGVTKFTDTDLDFSILRHGILPKLKYTTDDRYLVLKGKKDHKTRTMIKGYRELAKEVLYSDYYYGADFSFGDLEIKERANNLNGKGPGNHRNWVTIAANHHIAVVIQQLSKSPGI